MNVLSKDPEPNRQRKLSRGLFLVCLYLAAGVGYESNSFIIFVISGALMFGGLYYMFALTDDLDMELYPSRDRFKDDFRLRFVPTLVKLIIIGFCLYFTYVISWKGNELASLGLYVISLVTLTLVAFPLRPKRNN
jgi:hypothetical protein